MTEELNDAVGFISSGILESKLEELFEKGTYDEKCFSESGASYDLRLGTEVFITPEKEPRFLDENQVVNIKPGQFAALMTEEFLTMPKNLIGFITIRFRYKSKGLINISGFHVDPGFKGKLVFTVYNVGPSTVSIRKGDKVFSIFYSTIKPPTEYNKKADYYGQKNIPLSIIEALAGEEAPSLKKLQDEIRRNTIFIQVYGAIIVGVIITLLLELVGNR